MSAEKQLVSLVSFRISIILPVVSSLALGSIIRFNTPLAWDLSSSGWNSFLEVFKVPLGVLALIFPSVALIASNHRSRQSAKLISLQNSQNNFVNHYTHMDKFEQHCRELTSYKDSFLAEHNPRIFHSIMYPRSRDGDYSFNSEFLEKFGKKNGELYFRAAKITNDFANKVINRNEARVMLDAFIIESLKFVLFVYGQSRIPLDHLRKFSNLISTVASLSAIVQAFTEFDGGTGYRLESDYFYELRKIAINEILGHQDILLDRYKDKFDISIPGAADLYKLFNET